MCLGVNESLLLPLLLSNLTTTEICLMFLIEKQGPDIAYRSRNCRNDNTSLCVVCKSSFDTLTHFHHIFLKQSCSEFKNGSTESQQKTLSNISEIEIELKEEIIDTNEVITEDNIDELILKCKKGDQAPPKDLQSFSQHDIKIENKKDFEKECQKDVQIESNEDVVIKPLKGKPRKSKEANLELEHICEDCGELFKSKKALKNHISSAHKMPKYSCEKCGIEINSKEDLQKHIKQKHPELVKTNFSCPFCSDSEFKSKPFNKIKSHIMLSHFDQKENPAFADFVKKENIKCNYCDALLNDAKSLKSHIYYFHRDFVTKYTCEECGKGFTEKNTLQNHFKSFHVVEEVACEYCGKIFQNMGRKSTHIRLQHANDGGNCKVCNKYYSKRFQLLRHARIFHLKQTSATCTQCGKSLDTKKSLEKHIKKVHERVRPFGCEKCEYKASSLFNMNLHRSKMHNDIKPINYEDYEATVINGTHPTIQKEMLPLMKLLKS